MSARAFFLLCVSVCASMVLASCITPSIPIPPPDPVQMTFDVQAEIGEARFSYSPAAFYANATVYIFNRRTGTGVIDSARDDGSVGPSLPFPAALGDPVIVSFEREDQTVSTCIVIRQGRQSPSDVCR